MRNAIIWTALALTVTLCTETVAFDKSLPEYIPSKYGHSVSAWLNQRPGFRVATDADCSCRDDIAHVRAGNPPEWPAVPDYHPFYIVGDFRSDGTEDMAIGVIAQQHPEKFRVLIIHGVPIKRHTAKTFLGEELDLRQGLFYGFPRPKPWRLLVGPFESEGVTFEPTHDGYRLSDEDENKQFSPKYS